MALAAKIFETSAARAGRRQGARLSRRSPARRRRRSALFGLGYAPPDRFALRDALAAKGVDAPQMIEARLLVHGEDIAVPYDRFRDRVMFPIHDRSGRVVAFGGRAMEPGAKAKYLNSPGDRAFSQGLAALQPPSRPQSGP